MSYERLPILSLFHDNHCEAPGMTYQTFSSRWTLLIIALGYGLWSRERESGTLRQLLSTAVDRRTLLHHGAYLNGRGVGTQQFSGRKIKRVVHGPSRMIGRDV